MDNENFKQQFTQNVRSASVQPAVAVERPSSLPLIISLALAAIVLVESIALVITLTNYFSLANPNENVEEVFNEEDYVENSYFFDDDGNLSAMELVCTSEAGNKYNFRKDNTYTKVDSGSNQTGSGTYSIIKDSVIPLDGEASGKVVYFDGFEVAEGTTLYACEEVANNENSAE